MRWVGATNLGEALRRGIHRDGADSGNCAEFPEEIGADNFAATLGNNSIDARMSESHRGNTRCHLPLRKVGKKSVT